MHIHAIYENGILRPLEPLNIKEHEEVEIVIKEKISVAKMSQGIVQGDKDVIEEVALNPLYSCMEEE
ncbi:MAG: antitoxin family protein [Deltaproteobacteria bacterium]|nr:antitoxin family protein [Deltaproteobacteria bacterium]